jgi:hypothetical protein
MKSNQQPQYPKHCKSAQKNQLGGTWARAFKVPPVLLFYLLKIALFCLLQENKKP